MSQISQIPSRWSYFLKYYNISRLILCNQSGSGYNQIFFLAPPGSFIHIDEFEGPKQLAEYLKELDKDDQKYLSYFQWRNIGSLQRVKFFCRTCAMLNFNLVTKHKHPEVDWDNWWWNQTCFSRNLS